MVLDSSILFGLWCYTQRLLSFACPKESNKEKDPLKPMLRMF
jgi:hypothetical protein